MLRKTTGLVFALFFIGILSAFYPQAQKVDPSQILSFEVNPKEQKLQMFWKDASGKNYQNFNALSELATSQNKKLVFATNGGMYLKDHSPQGLYIENGKVLNEINQVQVAYGNFYMQPNGIFYITKNNTGAVCATTEFKQSKEINFATQSGPMLVINNKIHPKFTAGSSNVHIRNGVGILPNGNVLFAMSKEKINFFDFATYFKVMGCKNALYLDGFVSRTYLPAQHWQQTDGNFGVMIGVME